MRIGLISAHFPPDFVSGGTLQPQRLARALRAAGHDVVVLAGSLDPDRTPMATWDEVDDWGVDIRWVASGRFIGWDDPANYDNPGATDVAAELWREWKPDVVHAHSLQGLGVGVIDAAADLGISVVLTMHDFWWVCARQFLVDLDHRPCPLVVTASDCQCQAGRSHLVRRTDRLNRTLQRVDRVLVPSQTAADVLIANGVPSDRTFVDPNGVPHPPQVRPRDEASPSRRLVARYTGGSNPMKGGQVLLQALALLPPDLPLDVIAHGLDDDGDRQGATPPAGSEPGLTLTLAPPYAPEALDEVLGDTDVLLLPSVMRETFSIMTREALLRGVPVIATDSLGPEEVVRDGENGRIVASGDPQSLADALAEAAADPSLVRRWRQGITELSVRSVEDHADALLQHYRAAAPGRVHRAPAPARVLFLVGIDGAPMRYRAQLPAEALALAGIHADIRHYRDPDARALALSADVLVVYRTPATPQVLRLIEEVRDRGAPVAFDVDDLIFDPDIRDEIPALRLLPPAEADLWLEGVRRYRTTLEACDAFIGSTPLLVRHAESVTGKPAHLFENGVGSELGRLSATALRDGRRPGPLRVGFLSGTTTHDEDWALIEPAVAEVMAAHPDAELWLGGHLRSRADEILGPGRVRHLPFMSWRQLPVILRDLDVNLAPLASESRFNDAKSHIKWLEAALVRTPTVASPTEPFRAAIDDGRTGRLATTPDEWVQAIDELLRDAPLRARIGRNAQRESLMRWSPHRQAERYRAILDELLSCGPPAEAATTWQAVTRDEPPLAVRTPLEPYAGAEGDPEPLPPRRRWREWSGTGRRAVAALVEGGPAEVVRRSRRSVAHRLAERRSRRS